MQTIIEFKNVTKKFDNAYANAGISFGIFENKVNCIIGENGAGKSTLMKILFGSYKADEGEIFLRGNKVSFKNTNDAIKCGIGMLFQHFMLIDDFTVMENVILGDEITNRFSLNKSDAAEKLNELIGTYNLGLDINKKVSDLSISEQQKTEILKLLYRNSEIIILDEPTAVLSPYEINEFFKIVRKFLEEKKTIILITHKLAEIKEIADYVYVLRYGKLVYQSDKSRLDMSELSRQIIGATDEKVINSEEEIYTGNRVEISEKILIELKNVYLTKDKILKLNGISMSLHKSEIIGICGVEGNGQSEITDVICGFNKKFTGEYISNVKEISIVPDDRLKKGMIKEFSVGENILLRTGNTIIFSRKKLLETEKKITEEFDIRIPYFGTPMQFLSGGNQQKAIVAREVIHSSEVVLFSHPTRGVDIKASSFIYDKIINLKNEGRGIIIISADIDELLFLSDKLLILYKGKFVKEYNLADLQNILLNERAKLFEDIGKYMIGETE